MSSYSPTGLSLTKFFEDCRLTAYQDAVGVWTIGWGHTGQEVHGGWTITQVEADTLLDGDLSRLIPVVENLLTHPATQGQFDALIDFAYNEGAHALATSTLLRLFNEEDLTGAALQFAEWDNGTPPHILQGLVRRRMAEVVLRFLA